MSTLDPRHRAEQEQLAASDPAVSAFVSANAGSGKTKLLTDRLLRLMLAGAAPGRVQCLTFTKAAAAEMALRLQARLGRWVTLPDDALEAELRGLEVAAGEEARARARSLFAEVLDLPGGMRIGTIHAFCQSLLRRFPLEAELSPHFRLVDETEARGALDAARERMLGEADEAVRGALGTLAGLSSSDGFARLVADLEEQRDRLRAALALAPEQLVAAQRRAAGVGAADETALVAEAADWPGAGELAAALRAVLAEGSPKVRERAARMLDWLSQPPARRAARWGAWLEELLTAAGVPRGLSVLCNDKLARARPELAAALADEQARVTEIEDRRRALRAADASAALLTLAGPVLRAYAGQKDQGGQLDYDDLVARASRLLVDPGAAWVLYKLDGGLDHLLLDEVQDTAPTQWRIARALTEEFFAGLGARDAARSFFAVGDPKQSIYSFQGADPVEFERSRAALRGRAQEAGQVWRDVTLDVSFRSTAPVLALVDATFAEADAARGVVGPGEALRHYANRAGEAGRVELWPLVPVEPAPEVTPWTVPERNLGLTSAPQRLAESLAGWIGEQVSGRTMLESRGRPLGPGDVLVLVRRRGDFARALVRVLKARGVPVAGLDRLVLTDQAAVQDLMALCEALLLPEDDLTLACVLTSPLGGLSDDSLMALAAERPAGLWQALRARAGERAEWAAAWRFLSALLARADYVSPHALLVEALGELGGRARLYARLGPEAAEPVDEMLNAALAYGASHPPSLQGFLHWLRGSSAEVKREAEAAGGAVRVMTVHGAKGLQAPLVVLPDTTAMPPDEGALTWAADPQTGTEVPLWVPRKEFRFAAVDTLRATGRRLRDEEYRRLLYVALTRAEDRLVVCGWETRRRMAEDCWYRLVERGFTRLDGVTEEAFGGAWGGTARVLASAQRSAPPTPDAARVAVAPVALPGWTGAAPGWRPSPPPPEPPLPRPLAPSRPEGATLGPVPRTESPLSATPAAGHRFRRGQLVHALLCHLPDLPPAERPEAALRYATRLDQGLTAAEGAALAGEVMAVLEHPELAPLFGPQGRGELSLAGAVGEHVVVGVVDRLAVLPDRVLLADFKTNRDPPRAVEDTPVLYLRQMAAYRAVLRGIYPGRPVVCALVWTRRAAVSILPDALLESHDPTVARPA